MSDSSYDDREDSPFDEDSEGVSRPFKPFVPPTLQDKLAQYQAEWRTQEKRLDLEYLERKRKGITADVRDLGIRHNKQLGQRLASRKEIGFTSGYIDEDNSGTWHPKFERATPPPSPVQKRPRLQKVDENRNPVSHRAKKGPGKGYVVSSEVGSNDEGNLGSQGDGNDSGYASPQGRGHRKRKPANDLSPIRPDGLIIDQLTEDHPQRRGCKVCFENGDDECSLLEHPSHYPCDGCRDTNAECQLIIPPRLKDVCQRCKRRRQKCSFRDNGGQGISTCQSCEDAGEVCIAGPLSEAGQQRLQRQLESRPIRPLPTRSRPSEIDTSSSSKALVLSRAADIQRTSPLPPRLLELDPLDRIFVSCTQCRELGLTCNLKRTQAGPCRHCRKAGETCRFVHGFARNVPSYLLSIKNGQLGGEEQMDDENGDDHGAGRASSPSTNTRTLHTDYLSRKQPTSTKGKQVYFNKHSQRYKGKREGSPPKLFGATMGIRHIEITTPFCHPIRFFFIPDKENKHPCSWCDSFTFGLWAFGLRTVEVIPWGKEIGNEEISGGHEEQGRVHTKMCQNCCLERAQMIACEHNLAPMQHTDPDALDIEKIKDSIVALTRGGDAGGSLAKRVKWCSICVAPAEFECTQQECGLRLCETCEDIFKRIVESWRPSMGHLQVLNHLVRLWLEEAWKRDYEGQLRADAELLTTTGELYDRFKYLKPNSIEDDPLKEVLQRRDGLGVSEKVVGFRAPSQVLSTSRDSPQASKRVTGVPNASVFIPPTLSIPRTPTRETVRGNTRKVLPLLNDEGGIHTNGYGSQFNEKGGSSTSGDRAASWSYEISSTPPNKGNGHVIDLISPEPVQSSRKTLPPRQLAVQSNTQNAQPHILECSKTPVIASIFGPPLSIRKTHPKEKFVIDLLDSDDEGNL